MGQGVDSDPGASLFLLCCLVVEGPKPKISGMRFASINNKKGRLKVSPVFRRL
jgi:hypothetical protein